MATLKFEEYKEYIQLVHRNEKKDKTCFFSQSKWKRLHSTFLSLKKRWQETYFNEIFIKSRTAPDISSKIYIIFWESCGEKKGNYAFSNLQNKIGKGDTYLKMVCNRSGVNFKSKKKKEILIDLAKKGILIVDLYPTHGIKIKPSQRKNFSDIFNNYTSSHLKVIKERIKKSNMVKKSISDKIYHLPCLNKSYELKQEKKEGPLSQNKKKIARIFGKRNILLQAYDSSTKIPS